MGEAFEILEKINWFLKPVSDFILFFFTTKTGFILLVLGVIAYLTIPAFDAVRQRKLFVKAASNLGGRISLAEKIFVFAKTVSGNITKIFSRGPVIIISLLLMIFIVAMSTGISTVNRFVQNRQKIIELKAVVKQLDRYDKIAEIEVLEVNRKEQKLKVSISYFDPSIQKMHPEKQVVELNGTNVYLDFYVLNFEFSEIVDNNKRTLVMPYRIYGDKTPASEGVALNLKDQDSIPLIYKRSADDVYSMSADKYDEHIKTFAKYLTDEKEARKAGIRSSHGQAIHNYYGMKQGQILSVFTEQTGGLVIKKKENF